MLPLHRLPGTLDRCSPRGSCARGAPSAGTFVHPRLLPKPSLCVPRCILRFTFLATTSRPFLPSHPAQQLPRAGCGCWLSEHERKCETGWVSHCTSCPGISWSIATAGAPAGATAADPTAQSHPPTTRAVHRACAHTGPPPPCTPPQRAWMSGPLHRPLRHSWEHCICRLPCTTAAADPTAQSHPPYHPRRPPHMRAHCPTTTLNFPSVRLGGWETA